jgi:hypothetical protein
MGPSISRKREHRVNYFVSAEAFLSQKCLWKGREATWCGRSQ